MSETPVNRIADLVDRLLERGYTQTAQPVLNAMARDVSSGIVQQRLNELNDEAARLTEAGERLQPDNPVLRALLADLDPVLERNAARMDAAAFDLERGASETAGTLTRQLALPGLDDRRLRAIGVQWNTPDPEAVQALVNYTGSDAWRELLDRYPGAISDTVRNQAIQGIANGWGPLRTAEAITGRTQVMPQAQANTLMRTLQLESYRSATAIHQTANADILEGQVRIGTLDDRICLACLSLHGSLLPIGEKVADHHAGRCTSIAIVRGRERFILNGETWYNDLPADRQRAIAGSANYDAMQAGRVQLRDFVQDYSDPVFGQMVREASLSGLIGDAAKQYYRSG